MGLPRTFVGFSSTDIHYYRLMQAWKEKESIDFDFADCQLGNEVNSEDESYIKRKCRERINMAGTFISLIGEDTASKHKYVHWEIDVALEKGCRIIAVNLNDKRSYDAARCPAVLNNAGAIFVPFSAAIIKYALENFKSQGKNTNYAYVDSVYKKLGYD